MRADAAWAPHGRALLDHQGGRRPAVVTVHTVGGDPELVDAEVFFRTPETMEPWERRALELCGRRVLDVGAAAGCHALALGNLGRQVVAIDVCREATQVMERRGVPDARCARVGDVSDGPFDTLLLLMHGVGLVGDLEGLHELLNEAGRLLSPEGSVLLDSRDPGAAGGPQSETAGFGVAEIWLQYGDVRGEPFPWLFVDAAVLASEAIRAGWTTEVVYREPDGRYLARLVRASQTQSVMPS